MLHSFMSRRHSPKLTEIREENGLNVWERTSSVYKRLSMEKVYTELWFPEESTHSTLKSLWMPEKLSLFTNIMAFSFSFISHHHHYALDSWHRQTERQTDTSLSSSQHLLKQISLLYYSMKTNSVYDFSLQTLVTL